MSENYAPPLKEQVFLVGATIKGPNYGLSLEDSLDELALLAETAGLEVAGQATQVLRQIDPATFIGSGKVEEIRETLELMNLRTVLFDDELSPRHQRELEKRLGSEIKVLDRSALILDIFAQHANTREGTLQVELAQYEYRLPRLTRQWTHLARQAGGGGSRSGNAGVGLRGPGETQLEVDRREIRRKISKLKTDLDRVRQHRAQHRLQRSQSGIPVAALVGYTNAGKSTLINALTKADVYAADQLFATLDPTTRKLRLPSNRLIVITDTVGFIQKLPSALIAAFRATLEEITEADLLLHVVDASHPNALHHIEVVEDTLAEIDVPRIPRILVWNKADLIDSEVVLDAPVVEPYDAEVIISAVEETGLEELLKEIDRILTVQLKTVQLLIPYENGDVLSRLFEQGHIESQEHTGNGVLIHAQIPTAVANRYKAFIVEN